MLDQLALDDAVDQADVARPPWRRSACRVVHHLQRLLDAGDARQALRPARAGQQAELDLGNAQLRVGHGDPIMAAERDLEPAAERGAVDRRDHRLGAILDRVDHARQPRHHRRLAEFGDVGAGEEGLPFAADDDRLDRVVAFRLLDRRDQALPHRRAERVHRRVVRGDDQHVAVAAGRNRAGGGLVDDVGHVVVRP